MDIRDMTETRLHHGKSISISTILSGYNNIIETIPCNCLVMLCPWNPGSYMNINGCKWILNCTNTERSKTRVSQLKSQGLDCGRCCNQWKQPMVRFTIAVTYSFSSQAFLVKRATSWVSLGRGMYTKNNHGSNMFQEGHGETNMYFYPKKQEPAKKH